MTLNMCKQEQTKIKRAAVERYSPEPCGSVWWSVPVTAAEKQQQQPLLSQEAITWKPREALSAEEQHVRDQPWGKINQPLWLCVMPVMWSSACSTGVFFFFLQPGVKMEEDNIILTHHATTDSQHVIWFCQNVSLYCIHCLRWCTFLKYEAKLEKTPQNKMWPKWAWK